LKTRRGNSYVRCALLLLALLLPAAGVLGQDTAPAAPEPPYRALFYVAAVNVVIWGGIFVYLVYLDRRLRAATKSTED
jgi:CcmD family protein